MAIDPVVVGTTLPTTTLTLDSGRLKFFAKAIGETNPVFSDDDAARAAGHPAIPVPPTFLFAVEMEQPDPFAWLLPLGVDLRFALHGEQRFTYYTPAHAGDVVTATPRISDVYSKKGGALEFIVKDTTITRADDVLIAELTSVIVVRTPGAGQ
ncbi:MaoC family dehydratase N-terminal domain-containing protein [Nocardia sp. NPDC058176]|uniref:MaoC family dehydratase N-terminal domain-containing protein n=1 Tax=Nocardia sp. NPDC058176 TaxID=3346368 RepID=UPI0036D7F809